MNGQTYINEYLYKYVNDLKFQLKLVSIFLYDEETFEQALLFYVDTSLFGNCNLNYDQLLILDETRYH